MSHPLEPSGAVELAFVERSGLIESRHLGAVVVTAEDGEPARTLGDATALVYPRSTLKLFQALAVAASGVELDGERLVLATASHGGTADHVRIVRSLLADAGLDESALQCPADLPLDRGARDDVVLAGGSASPVYMNCSGKHAAFLFACVVNGWPTDSYLDLDHPLQVRIRSLIEEFSGETIEHSGVDGCGAPVHALSLTGLARAVSRLSRREDPASARLVAAILANPWAIEAPGRPNTTMVTELGLVAKGGAEGVLVVGAPSGVAVAIKVLDGSSRALAPIALRLLADAGVITSGEADRVAALTAEPVLGGGRAVGVISASF